jgi:transposase InsO family protein
MDRDATVSKSFRACQRREGVKPVRLPPRSSNLNAHLKRFSGSLKSECLQKLILLAKPRREELFELSWFIITLREIIRVYATK